MPKNSQRHPVEDLFNALKTVEPYPDGVKPVPKMLSGTAFFPGGSGLWLGESSLEAAPNWLPMPIGKVMVLGNDFCNSPSGHQEWLENDPYADLKTATWQHLRPLLQDAGIPLEDCFFTNAYMGLRPESGPWTGLSPGACDKKFVQRCQSFLDKQIEVQKPRLILVLGRHARKFIAPLSDDLTAWKGYKTFEKLDDDGVSFIEKVRFKGTPEQPVTVVVLVHPSFRPANVWRRHYCGLKGHHAEIAMLKKALNLSGLQ